MRLYATPNGEIVATSDPTWWSVVVVDANGKAVVSWQDSRAGNKDVYAQCLDFGIVAVEGQPAGPAGVSLSQNVPNPFTVSTRITFRTHAPESTVHLGVYNVAGRLVRTLYRDQVTAEEQTVYWDGPSSFGLRLSPGVYYMRLANQAGVKTRTVVLGD